MTKTLSCRTYKRPDIGLQPEIIKITIQDVPYDCATEPEYFFNENACVPALTKYLIKVLAEPR